ncbi:hemerythrin domain-containing protein [Reyranella sp.]|uniref:hemerythrin domain-containing protein n=1 Tax=Reyranella sp. TaxID=1929291 RepID=UPI003BA9675B
MSTTHSKVEQDALALLTAGSRAIEQLGRAFARRPNTADRVETGKLALRVCHALGVHAAIKEEVFYPAAEAVLAPERQELVAVSRRDQDEIGHLVEAVERTPADDPGFDAAFEAVLERTHRLAEREEKDLFPALRHSGLDLAGTGERMAARRAQLATRPVDRETIASARRVMGGRP